MSSGMIFVIVIVAIVTIGRMVRTGMELEARKSSFSLDGKRGRRFEPVGQPQELEQENAQLRRSVARLEDRMAVLERIATDAPTRLTAEIEKLRD